VTLDPRTYSEMNGGDRYRDQKVPEGSRFYHDSYTTVSQLADDCTEKN
jgi:hypothetical protein